ncbi:hypothetical protein Q2Y23_001642 [Vibrio fluvialis]|nr:hypothetical protein [Vibrio fluvialis]
MNHFGYQMLAISPAVLIQDGNFSVNAEDLAEEFARGGVAWRPNWITVDPDGEVTAWYYEPCFAKVEIWEDVLPVDKEMWVATNELSCGSEDGFNIGRFSINADDYDRMDVYEFVNFKASEHKIKLTWAPRNELVWEVPEPETGWED